MQTDVPRSVKQVLLNVYANLLYPYGIRETLVTQRGLMEPRRPLWHCGTSWNHKAIVTLGWDGAKETTEILQTKDPMVTLWKLMEPWAL